MPAIGREVLDKYKDVNARNTAYVRDKYNDPYMRASRKQYDFGSGGVHVEEVKPILHNKDLSHVKGM